MARRPCLTCGRPTTGTRCPTCGTSPGRNPARRNANYGHRHRTERARIAATLPAPCWYCEALVHPDQPWVAAHVVDGEPDSPRVPAHPACNERAKPRS